MTTNNWDFPKTEEGFQQALAQLKACREAGDHRQVGYGLLKLSFLVKWVRSDKDTDPFKQSAELAKEAYEEFLLVGDETGLVKALVAASATIDFESGERCLSQAQDIAETLGDEVLLADVMAGRGRKLGLCSKAAAFQLSLAALVIYEKHDLKAKQATCLFSLSLQSNIQADKSEYAIQASKLYREVGDLEEAARCLQVAGLMNESLDPTTREQLLRQSLEDALAVGNRSLEGGAYLALSKVLAEKGDKEEAAKYVRWANEIESADGLTPKERRKERMMFTKNLIGMMKKQGNHEGAKVFQNELERLKRG